jgi:hypothetical protein
VSYSPAAATPLSHSSPRSKSWTKPTVASVPVASDCLNEGGAALNICFGARREAAAKSVIVTSLKNCAIG